MKTYITVLSAMFLLATGASAQRTTEQIVSDAADQLRYQASRIPEDGKFPRTLVTDYSIPEVAYHLERAPKDFYPEPGMSKHPSVKDFNTVAYVNYHDWTSGFYPGSLWLAYEMTGNEDLRDLAARYTNQLLPVSRKKDTHDLGFMVNCSYGNALRLAPDDSIKNVIVATADNLIGRFDPKVGLIRSWDWGKWNYPVIIDNMMNLQLLFNASKLTGDPKYRDIAVKHADKTMRNHFRPDYSSYHVVSYTPDGRVESRGTYQGKSHDSAWSRGQAWGLYGSRFLVFLCKSNKVARPFFVVYALVAILGATMDLGLLWSIADTFNGLMSIPNLMALLLLSGTVAKLTKEFFAGEGAGK